MNGSVDPICGMHVDPAKSLSCEHQGKTHYFCSEHCRSQFVQSVDERTHGEPAVAAVARTNEVSARHESRQNAPAVDERIYTCPMHPEVEQVGPGSCPKCGMILEPKIATTEDDDGSLTDMAKRFWIAAALSVPLLILAMGPMIGLKFESWVSPQIVGWLEMALATPVVLWCGWPLLVRGWQSIRNLSPNMFTLIAIGTLAAFLFSISAVVFPTFIPKAFHEGGARRSTLKRPR